MFHHDILVIKTSFQNVIQYSLEAITIILTNNTKRGRYTYKGKFGKSFENFRPSDFKLYPNREKSRNQAWLFKKTKQTWTLKTGEHDTALYFCSKKTENFLHVLNVKQALLFKVQTVWLFFDLPHLVLISDVWSEKRGAEIQIGL